jgi:hypothetical protein
MQYFLHIVAILPPALPSLRIFRFSLSVNREIILSIPETRVLRNPQPSGKQGSVGCSSCLQAGNLYIGRQACTSDNGALSWRGVAGRASTFVPAKYP